MECYGCVTDLLWNVRAREMKLARTVLAANGVFAELSTSATSWSVYFDKVKPSMEKIAKHLLIFTFIAWKITKDGDSNAIEKAEA